MWFKMKKTVIPVLAMLVAAGLFGARQAYALNDDETAVLVGVAVGGLAAISTKHHLDHDRWDRNRGGYSEYHYYEREAPRRYCPPKRVEHYVIHEPPRYREYEREYKRVGYGRGHGHDRGRHRGWDKHGRRGGGYEYEYVYSRTGF